MGGLITPSFNMGGQVVVESSSIGTRFDNMLVLGLCGEIMRISWPDCIAGLKQFDLAYWFLSVQVRTVGLDMFGPVTIFLFTATTIMIQVYTWGVLNPGSFQIDDHYVVQFLGLKRLRSKAVVHHWRPWTFGSRGSWCPQIHRPKFMFCWCHFLWLVASYCIIPLIGPAGQPMRFAKQAPKRFPQKDIVDNPLTLIRIRDTLVPEWCPKIYGLYIYIYWFMGVYSPKYGNRFWPITSRKPGRVSVQFGALLGVLIMRRMGLLHTA